MGNLEDTKKKYRTVRRKFKNYEILGNAQDCSKQNDFATL